jgi:hypothetical protein
MREQKNTFGHAIALSFLMLLLGAGALSASLQKQFESDRSKVTVTPYEIYHRQKVNSASSTYAFLNNLVDKAVGITNVDKAKLPTYQAFVFDRVAVGYSTSATSGSPVAGSQLYNTTILSTLRNVDFEIIQNGRTVLEMPIVALHNQFRSTGTSVADQYVQLGSFCYLVDDVEFEWNLKFPSGISVENDTTNSHFLEVRLNGWRANKRTI